MQNSQTSLPDSMHLPLDAPNLKDNLQPLLSESGDTMGDSQNMTPGTAGKNQAKDIGTSVGSRQSSRKGGRGRSKYDELQADLTNLLGSLALGLCMVPAFSQDGMVIVQRAAPLSEKLVAVARKHDGLYEALKALTTSSIYGALALELGTIIMAIASNHGVSLPIPGLGQPDPEEVAA